MKKLLCATTLSLALLSGVAKAENMLADKIDGQLTLSGNLGYIYNFSGSWQSHNSKSGNTVGYGLSFGYDHKSGFGISSEYLTYTHSYNAVTGESGSFSYRVPYPIVTFTPSYRANFGKDDNWYVKTGLGLGFSLSSIESLAANVQVASGLAAGAHGGQDQPLLYTDSQFSAVDFSDRECDVYVQGPVSLYPDHNYVFRDRYAGREIEIELINVLLGTSIDLQNGDCLALTNESGGSLAKALWIYDSSTGEYQTYSADYDIVRVLLHVGGEGLTEDGLQPQVAVDDAGFVIAPTLTIGYDDDMFHFDITTKYIHALKDVLYHGENDAPDQTQNKGPLAFYIGVGTGVNF
ncbi:MAG: hypothetical protein ACR2NY_03300 [Alphaproteobacteria bacterium]